jgi:hypothetical protein
VDSLDDLKPFARLPQGLPEGLDLRALPWEAPLHTPVPKR